jgi:hypothetical protein
MNVSASYREILMGNSGRAAPKAQNHTTICEPTVRKMWDPPHLKILQVFQDLLTEII